MKLLKCLLVISVALLINSCSGGSRSSENFSEFKETYFLKGISHELENPIKSCLLFIEDSLLVLTSIIGSDNQIQIYNLNTFNFVAKSGKIGRAPGEISGIGPASLFKRCIYYEDIGKRSILVFNLDSIINNPNYVSETYIPLPEETPFLIYFETVEDSLISYLSTQDSTLVSFFNFDGRIIDSISIRDLNPIYSYKDLNYASRHYMANFFYAIHPENGKTAIVYTRSDVLKIIDENGSLLKRWNGPGKVFQIPNYDDNSQISTNTFIKYDSDFIYALYKNQPPLDETGMRSNFSRKINIYNWDGEPKCQLNFEHPVLTFVVDRKHNRIITYSPDIDMITFYEFDFSLL